MNILIKPLFKPNLFVKSAQDSMPENKIIVEEIKENESKTEKKKRCIATISEISKVAEVTIFFNHNLKPDLIDVKDINSTLLDVYIEPSSGREQEDGFDLKKINITW